jgi:ppGpp synthetase/RelA/SpoT-type nucleotidyltranferase
MALTTMEDIGGVRVVMQTQDQVDAVVADLLKQPGWNPMRRVREYVVGRDPGPKADGYRAVHLVVVRDGCYVEIQLRNVWQDAWAQSVEEDTRRLKAGLKFGAGPDDLREYYAIISEYYAMRERSEQPDEGFMASLAKKFRATRSYFPTDEEEERP